MRLPDRQRWQQLSPLLDELLDLDPLAQSRRLAALRVRDARLARELDSMVRMARHAAAAGFLEGTAPVGAPPAAPDPGPRLGAYLIEAPLGQGRAGTLWRARRPDGRFEGMLALKLLHPGLVTREGAARFAREAGRLSRLAHDHLAPLLDAGVAPDGRAYLVRDLVAGLPLDQHCEAMDLGWASRAALLDDVLAAVTHLHARSVIHRDIKPTNVFVTPHGHVKLLDAGIGQLLQHDVVPSFVDEDGAPRRRYAAPEQLHGGAVSTATDVYALGMLLCRLLVPRMGPEHRAGLRAVVGAATHRNPTQRTPSCDALAHELRALSRHA